MTEDHKADFCDNYCKYPWIINSDDLLMEVCEHCPLNDVEDKKA